MTLCLELLSSYNLCAVLDAGVGDGQMALAAALQRVPYAGACLTEEHMAAVTERIVCQIMLKMLHSNEPVYEAKFAASFLPRTQHRCGYIDSDKVFRMYSWIFKTLT